MRTSLLAAAVLAISVPASAQVVYRCKDADGSISITDHGCASSQTAVRQETVQQRSPQSGGGDSPMDHYNRYLQMQQAEHDRARGEQERSFADVVTSHSENHNYTGLGTNDEARRRLQSCEHDQRVDEMRSGRARYTCDSATGQKVLPPRVYAPSRGPVTRFDQHGNAYTDYQNGSPLIDQQTGRPCMNMGGGSIQCN